MCHDERFLNLWITDLRLLLFQTTFNDKSSYDHVKLLPDSFTFVGFEWKGWYFCYKTLPFGWKASAYVYHTVGLAATCHIRSLGVPCSQYTAMSANSLYAKIFKILSSGPVFSLPRLLLLLCVQFWFALDTSLSSPNLFLFPRVESGFWVFCLIPSFKFPYSTR